MSSDGDALKAASDIIFTKYDVNPIDGTVTYTELLETVDKDDRDGRFI